MNQKLSDRLDSTKGETTRVSDDVLDEIERVAKAATDGQWFRCDFRELHSNPSVGDINVSCTWPDHIGICSMENGLTGSAEEALANAAHIARMNPPTALALVADLREAHARIRALEAANAEMVEALKDNRDRRRVSVIRECVTWLHDRANAMSHPPAKQVLNSAALDMGCTLGAVARALAGASDA